MSTEITLTMMCEKCTKNIDIDCYNEDESICDECMKPTNEESTNEEKNICGLCGKRAFYNFEEVDYGIRCKIHKEPNMVNILSKIYCERRFIRNIKRLGGKVKGKYKNARTLISCECNKGHVCKVNSASIQQGGGMCKICARNDKETAKHNFIKRINELGGKVKGEYKGKDISVACVCKNGHDCRPTPNNIRQGNGMCIICANRDPETAEQNFIRRINELGGKVKGEYKNAYTRIKCECKEGHCCSPNPSSIRQGHGMCIICANRDPETAKQNFIRRINELGGKVKGEYIFSNITVFCICKEGHDCNPTPNNIQRGEGMCSQCVISGGEMLLNQVFQKLQLESIFQSRHPLIPTLRYDYSCMFNGKLYYFEFDGIQHFEFTKFFHETEENYKNSRQRDLLKIDVCKMNNIKMIRIDYTWMKKSLDEWVEFIKSSLESDQQLILSTPELYGWVNESLLQETIDEYVESKY